MSEQDPFNLPEAQFDAVMTEIDRKLRQQSDRIPGREIGGLAEFCARFKVTLANTHPTTRRIFDWFDRMYGDRLKLDWDFGHSVVLIQGDIYGFRCVRFFGTMLLVCSPSVLGKKLGQRLGDGRILPINNLLEKHIDGLTLGLAARLSAEECDGFLEAYGRTFQAFSGLESALGNPRANEPAPYIREAMHDLAGSAESLLAAPPNYGQSKWDSLQAVEKVVKSCILEKGGTHKKSHGLATLFSEAEQLGVPAVNPGLITSVQCSAEVRYNSALVGKAEAVAAHHAALTICGYLAPVLKRTPARVLLDNFKFCVHNGETLDGLVLGFVLNAR